MDKNRMGPNRKMKRLAWYGAAAAAVLLLLPRPAGAWGNTWAGGYLEAAYNALRWRLGPVRYNAALMVYNTGYDSDIYFGMTGERTPDFTSDIIPDFQALYPISRKFVLEVEEQPQYAFFAKTEGERNFNNIASGRAHIVLDRWYFQASGTHSNVRERLSSDLNMRVRLNQFDMKGIALWQASKTKSVLVQYTASRLRYEDLTYAGSEISRNLDRNESYAVLGLLSQNRSGAIYYLNGEYGAIDFTDPLSANKNTGSYAAYAGIEFLPAPGEDSALSRISGRINVGFNWFDLKDPAQRDYKGWVCNTNLSLGLSRRTSVQASLVHGPRFSALSGMTFFIQNSFGGGFSHSFSRRVNFSYNIAFSRNKYQAAAGAAAAGSAVRDLVQSVRLGMQLRRSLSLTLLGGAWNRDSWMAVRQESSRLFAGIEFVFGYPGLEPTVPLIINTR